MNKSCCIIIPILNEAAHIPEVVRQIRQVCSESSSYCVLVVDDGSQDNSAELARTAGATVLRHEKNRGKGAALQTGFAYAHEHKFDVVLTMDGDGQHAPADIPRFVSAYERTLVPIVLGNRMEDTSQMPFIRRVTNRFMSALLSRKIRQYVPDTQCGFRLYAKETLPHLQVSKTPGYAAESEELLFLAQHGFRITSIPIQTIYGTEKSKIHPIRDTIRFFRMLRQFRKANPKP